MGGVENPAPISSSVKDNCHLVHLAVAPGGTPGPLSFCPIFTRGGGYSLFHGLSSSEITKERQGRFVLAARLAPDGPQLFPVRSLSLSASLNESHSGNEQEEIYSPLNGSSKWASGRSLAQSSHDRAPAPGALTKYGRVHAARRTKLRGKKPGYSPQPYYWR
jgi:hypothetical protein